MDNLLYIHPRWVIKCLDTYACDSSHGLIWLEDKGSAIKYTSESDAKAAAEWFSKGLGPQYKCIVVRY